MKQQHQDEAMTKEQSLKQRDAARQNAGISQLTKHFLILDLSKLPGADTTGMPEYGPFEAYYTQRFAADLTKFYDIDASCSVFPHPIAITMTGPRMDRDGGAVGANQRRLDLNFAGVRHFSMFAAAVFYTSACAQVIGRLYGRKAMEDFHKASGWPMLNCGMGGLMSPITVMADSLLFPYSRDVEEFVEVFDEASRYLEADFLDFLENNSANLNRKAYADLRKAVDVSAVRDELVQQRNLFVAWVRDPRMRYETHYVPVKVMSDL